MRLLALLEDTVSVICEMDFEVPGLGARRNLGETDEEPSTLKGQEALKIGYMELQVQEKKTFFRLDWSVTSESPLSEPSRVNDVEGEILYCTGPAMCADNGDVNTLTNTE